MIKKILLITGFYLGLQLALAAPGLAIDAKEAVCKTIEGVGEVCEESNLFGPGGTITNIVQTMVFIVGAIAVLMIVIGGIMYAISSGNPDRAKTAWQTILYAIIGVAVAIAAQAIVSFVLNKVG